MHRAVGKHHNPGIRRTILFQVKKTEARELLFQWASIFGDHFLRDRMPQVSETEPVLGKIGQGAVETRQGIKG